MQNRAFVVLTIVLWPMVTVFAADRSGTLQPGSRDIPGESDRSPVSFVLFANGTRAITANQTSGSVSLIDVPSRKVLDEIATGEKPAGVAVAPNGKEAIVTHWWGYDVAILKIENDKLTFAGRVDVGPEPRGVIYHPAGDSAFVAVGVSNEVALVDTAAKSVRKRIAVGREPRSLALTPDGKTLVVTNGRSQNVSLVDVAKLERTRDIDISGDNLRQVAISPDGKYAILANLKDRRFATTKNNIDIGWVIGQRVTRVPLNGDDYYETISLDPQGLAVGDVHGVAVSPDGRNLAISAGGTHEILLFRQDLSPLPWRRNGSRDLLAPELTRDNERLRRVKVGGRPLDLAFLPDGKTLIAANYFGNSLQILDIDSGVVSGEITLGGQAKPDEVRQGEMLFYDAEKSFNQWYSCATCHTDSHTNGLDFDTMNDGWHDLSTRRERSRKKVPTMRRVVHTGPWTWHGWQTSLDEAMTESFTKSMQGSDPSEDDVKAILAYIGTLDYPKNPYRKADGSLSEAALRGKTVFESAKAACNTCHSGPEFTDGKVHDVGLDEPGSRYKGHNPPSLRGTYDKDPYLHDRSSKTLHDLLKGPHSPEAVTGLGELNEQELNDLIEYVKSL